MNRQDITYLLELHCEGNMTDAQRRELSLLLQDTPEETLLAVFSELAEKYAATPYAVLPGELQPAVNRILQIDKMVATPVRKMYPWRGRAVAAIVIGLLAAAGGWWWQQTTHTPQHSVAMQDITAGKTGAILTLANGQQVVLDSAGKGLIATQQGTQVVLKGGQLAYEASGTEQGAIAWNVLTTSAGRQFSVVLPDGTKVWLNAASSIRYPARFAGTHREVFVSGEAYFEVAKNEQQPFSVNVQGKMEVKVLGTAFNINSYPDETYLGTTLLDGSIVVTNPAGESPVLLKPGQQAQLTGNQPIALKEQVAIDQVMAWKNGFFDFNNKSLRQVTGQIGRWYDITIVYDKNIRDVALYGKISREVPLSDMLKLLEATGLHFRWEGNRELIIIP
jgi:transmembrane sensor